MARGIGAACRWAMRVLEEFFAQGDRERAAGMAVSPMMDRTATSTALSQMNFIEFIVAPLYSQVPGLRAGQCAVIHERCRPNRRPWICSYVYCTTWWHVNGSAADGRWIQIEE